jgi:hypothetical protein
MNPQLLKACFEEQGIKVRSDVWIPTSKKTLKSIRNRIIVEVERRLGESAA